MYETDVTSSDNESENHVVTWNDAMETEGFSLDTDIKNVMKLQKYLQIEKEKYHKEHRSRITLENAKASLESNNLAYKKKIEILTSEKLSLEKLKLELELKLKQLELQLAEEKTKRINLEERKQMANELFIKNLGSTSGKIKEDIQVEIVRNSKFETVSEYSDEIVQLKDTIKNMEALFKTKEENWLDEKQCYLQQVNDFQNKSKNVTASSTQTEKRVFDDLENINSNLKNEVERLNIVINDKKIQIEVLEEEKQKSKRFLETLVPLATVNKLDMKIVDLNKKLQENNLSLATNEKMNALLKNQLMTSVKKCDEKCEELLKMTNILNEKTNENFSLKNEFIKLKVEITSCKNRESHLIDKIKYYETLQAYINEPVNNKLEIIMKQIEEKYQSEISLFMKEKVIFETQICDLTIKLKDKELEIINLNNSLIDLKDQNISSMKKLSCSEHEKKLLQDENLKLKSVVKELEEFNEKLKSLLFFFSTQISKLCQHHKFQMLKDHNIVSLLCAYNCKLKTVIEKTKRNEMQGNMQSVPHNIKFDR